MAETRHPLADSFSATLASLRLLTARLDDPMARGPVLPQVREGLAEILRGMPRPSRELCQELYAIQSDLHRLVKSQRNEYAIVEKINGKLDRARKLVDRPPLGDRR